MIDPRDAVFDARVNRLEDVRGLEAHAQFRKESQAMKGQRLVETFVQARRRRRIQSVSSARSFVSARLAAS